MVLHLIQEYYGPWNTSDNVFLSDQDEACIFVKDAAGDSVLLVNLTNLAAWYSDGSVSLEEHSRRPIVQPESVKGAASPGPILHPRLGHRS
jgi:hypothetical protein